MAPQKTEKITDIQAFIRINYKRMFKQWEEWFGSAEYKDKDSVKVTVTSDTGVGFKPDIESYGNHTFSKEVVRFGIAIKMLKEGQSWEDIETVTKITEARFSHLMSTGAFDEL